jgi:cob(I)alamin adenosyltransferase
VLDPQPNRDQETRIMLLLGAGASKEAGVPLAREMSQEIVNSLSRDRHSSHLLRFVLGGLLFQAGINGVNPLDSVDVEELFSAVDLLAERRRLEIAPFIGAWHPMVESLDRADRFTALGGVPNNLARAIERAFHQSQSSYESRSRQADLGRAIADIVQNEVRPGTGKEYRKLTDQMIKALQDLISRTSKDVLYLEPLARFALTQGRLTVATLNYDRTIELMGERYDVPVNTGIETWSQTGSFSTRKPRTGIKLLKLHGSIDWILQPAERSNERPMPHTVVRLRTGADGPAMRPAIVFGQRNKLRPDGPFLDLLREFREELKRSSHLVIVGYSFRDAHINQYVADWLNDDSRNTIAVMDPGFETSQQRFILDLRRYCVSRVEVIAHPASAGLRGWRWRRPTLLEPYRSRQ